MSTALRRLAPVDGVRSIAHISLVCLHTAMLLTGKLPAEGPLWQSFKSSIPFTVFQAGGIQVDIMFMLSGFLLVFNLLNKNSLDMPSVLDHTFRRWLRMAPMMLVSVILGHYVIQDCWGMPYTYWDGGKAIFPTRVMSYLLCYTNYCDQITYGSYLGSLMWSCAVDLQAGVLTLILVKFIASFYQIQQKSTLIRRLRVVFFILLVVACVIRGSFFNKDKVNMVLLGEFFHFRLLQPRSSYTWMEVFFGHEWKTTNSAVDVTHEYLNKMYFPTHTRYGPFMVGGVVACSLLLAMEKYKPKAASRGSANKGSMWSSVMGWIFTTVAVVQLAVPCLPAPPIEDVPLEAQVFVTAALRNLSACSAGFLMYRTLVPVDHPWHWASLNSFFSLRVWKAIAAISFVSYLIHFRLLMEIIYSVPMQRFFGLSMPSTELTAGAGAGADADAIGSAADALATEWLVVMVKVFLIGMAVSFSFAQFIHEFVEKPTATAIQKYVLPARQQSAKKVN